MNFTDESMAETADLLYVVPCADGPSALEHTCGHSVCAELHVAPARPEAGPGWPTDGPPGKPAVLGFLLRFDVGDA